LSPASLDQHRNIEVFIDLVFYHFILKCFVLIDIKTLVLTHQDIGQIVLHSSEGDGLAWGWEFDGKGGMEYFQLDPVGRWR